MNFQGMEVEMKYDAGPDAQVPKLADLPGVERAAPPRVDRLAAVYFDTPGRALAGRGITLRRRTGGADEGWHLKLAPEKQEKVAEAPEARRRREVHAPLGRPDVVPDSLLAHLHVYLRGADLAPVVRLETQRSTHALYGPDGVHLADLADDTVAARLLPAGAGPCQWREWEFELVHGGPELLGPAAELLAAAGATPAPHASKLAKALDALAAPAGAGKPLETSRPAHGESTPELAAGKEAPATAVVGLYFRTHLDQLLANDPAVRLGEPEAVHNMRSAVRRLRSALAAYRKLYLRAPVGRLADELKWLGGMLGSPRDAEVLRERLRRHAAELPSGKDSAAAGDRLDRHGAEELDAGYRRLLLALESGRYFRLLGALEDFRDAPPLRVDGKGGATRSGRKVAAGAVAKASKRLRRAQKKASGTSGPGDYEEALHRVRKDAKRLRHVAESAQPVKGRRARKVAKAAHRQQKVLGDFHDAVIARDLLASMGSGAPYAALHAREIDLMAAAEKKYRKARKKSRRRLQRGVA